MIFKVIDEKTQLPSHAKNKVYLLKMDWDDWFSYDTRYYIYYFNEEGEKISCGNVKIGQKGLKPRGRNYTNEKELIPCVEGERSPSLPQNDFIALSDNFFSLGQEENYYEFLGYSPETQNILKKLRDCAYDLSIFEDNQSESVMIKSLLRDISRTQVRNRFNRLAHGNAELTKFKFSYSYPQQENNKSPCIEFLVEPSKLPPSNVQVIIGRNGVGKTFLMKNIAETILHHDKDQKRGCTQFEGNIFSGLIFVSFSIFDDIDIDEKTKSPLKYNRIGYKGKSNLELKDFDTSQANIDFAQEFIESFKMCNNGLRKSRWESAISILSSDPMFFESNIKLLTTIPKSDIQATAKRLFKNLSSGHAILLLIITKLVELVEERTIVIIDEPEGHLHPPLLSTFVRCLSELLSSRNAVAIMGTHSPIVLQEVPKRASWILQRSGRLVSISHPKCETFGENIGTLTNEVFGLEVSNSGCNKLLADKVNSSNDTYEEILYEFNGELGIEAKAILRALIANRDKNQI